MNDQQKFWEQMTKKYEDRNAQLKKREIELRSVSFSDPTSVQPPPPPSGPCQMFASLMNKLLPNLSKPLPTDDTSEEQTKNCPDLAESTSNKKADYVYDCFCTNDNVYPQQANKDFRDCACNPCKGEITTIIPSSPNQKKLSLFSLKSCDLENMKRIIELVQAEKETKSRIRELEYKTINPTTTSYNNLIQENTLLRNELEDAKLELKQQLETVKGPMQHKLDQEHYKCQQLECQLKEICSEINKTQDVHLRELNSIKMQLCCACSNMNELSATNERLTSDLKKFETKCCQLEEDLVRQKLSEAHTIGRLKNQIEKLENSEEVDEKCECCDEDLCEIARKLSKALKDSEICGECVNVPSDIAAAAKCIKNLADLVGAGGQPTPTTQTKSLIRTPKLTLNNTPIIDEEKLVTNLNDAIIEIVVEDTLDRRSRTRSRSPLKSSQPSSTTSSPIPSCQCLKREQAKRKTVKCAPPRKPLDCEEIIKKILSSSTSSRPVCCNSKTASSGDGEDAVVERTTTPHLDNATTDEQNEQLVDANNRTTNCQCCLSQKCVSPATTSENKSLIRESKSKQLDKLKEVNVILCKNKPTTTTTTIPDLLEEKPPCPSITDIYRKDEEKKLETCYCQSKSTAQKIIEWFCPNRTSTPSQQPNKKCACTTSRKSVSIKDASDSGEASDGDVMEIQTITDAHADGTSKSTTKVTSSEKYLPLNVDTQIEVLDKKPDGVHVTTSVTKSGRIQVVTEGPEGVIETKLTYTDDGDILVLTEIIEENRTIAGEKTEVRSFRGSNKDIPNSANLS